MVLALNRLLILLNFISATQAWAFTLNNNINAGFGHDEVRIYVTSNSNCNNANITKEELLSMSLEAANQYWNIIPTSRLQLINGGILNTNDGLFLTGELCFSPNCQTGSIVPQVNDIVIACNSNDSENFPSSGSGENKSLAVALPNHVQSGKIKGAVILINDTPTTVFGTLSRRDMVAVLAHEIGHAIGLGHSRFSKNLMFFALVSERSRLGQDDIDGLTYLYPKKFDGCGLLSIDEDHGSTSKPGVEAFFDPLNKSVFLTLMTPLVFLFIRRRRSFSIT